MMEYKQYQTTILTKYLAKYDILIFLSTSRHYKNSTTFPKHWLGSQFFKNVDIMLMLVQLFQLLNIWK